MPEITRYTGGTIDLSALHIKELRDGLEGELLLPDDLGYDQASTVWNAAIDKRPALIARCANAADVVEIVRFARQHAFRRTST